MTYTLDSRLLSVARQTYAIAGDGPVPMINDGPAPTSSNAIGWTATPYGVRSGPANDDAGLVGVFVGCLPAKVDAVLQTVRDELAKVAAHGITAEELERGKGQLKGGLVLGLEDSGSRMSRLGKAELVYDELLTIDEVLGRIDAVTLDDVTTLARDLFTQPELLAVVGPER